MKTKSKKHCGHPLKTGKLCRGFPVKGKEADGKCLFHSKVPKVIEQLHQGRIKGARKTVRRQILASSLLVLKKIQNSSELLTWINTLNSEFYHGRINREDVTTFLGIANTLGKVMETREIKKELQTLKDQIESLEGKDVT